MIDFPDDDNGHALREMQANGDNLKKARTINFSVVFDRVDAAKEFQKVMSSGGHHSKLEDLEEGGVVDVTVSVFMLPTHQAISEFEEMLFAKASPLSGRNDGWGSFSQK